MTRFAVILWLLFASVAESINHTLGYVPFSWDTVPRYTFCVNSTGLLNDDAAKYISQQPIYLNNPVLTRPPGSISNEEDRIPRQAQALLKLNPKQQQWFYYAIDLIRPHNFENDHYVSQHPECLLKDINGKPVPRMVWDFSGGPGSCGFERWLNTSRAMVAGGMNGIFLDGFQGCDPFDGNGCQRICKNAHCDPETIKKWNAGLIQAMWALKKDVLGKKGTLVCNSTPGPYACKVGSKPVEECPCDGTNDERGGGSWDHENIVANIDATDGDYLMLTHVPHGNDKGALMPSIPKFLMAATKYQYHGSGFGYECTGGWLTGDADIQHAYAAPLGEPTGPAVESRGCATAPKCCAKDPTCSTSCHRPGDTCVRTRTFATGTKAFVNYTSGATCMMWSDGKNFSTKGKGDDGCDNAREWLSFSHSEDDSILI